MVWGHNYIGIKENQIHDHIPDGVQIYSIRRIFKRLCNFGTGEPSLVRLESHKEKHQWI